MSGWSWPQGGTILPGMSRALRTLFSTMTITPGGGFPATRPVSLSLTSSETWMLSLSLLRPLLFSPDPFVCCTTAQRCQASRRKGPDEPGGKEYPPVNLVEFALNDFCPHLWLPQCPLGYPRDHLFSCSVSASAVPAPSKVFLAFPSFPAVVTVCHPPWLRLPARPSGKLKFPPQKEIDFC